MTRRREMRKTEMLFALSPLDGCTGSLPELPAIRAQAGLAAVLPYVRSQFRNGCSSSFAVANPTPTTLFYHVARECGLREDSRPPACLYVSHRAIQALTSDRFTAVLPYMSDRFRNGIRFTIHST